MRLSPKKIDYLAEKLVKIMRERDDVSFNIDEDELTRAIAWEFEEELRIEDDIDNEVDLVLEQHERQIMSGDMDQMILRRKLKAKIARERGYTL